MKKVIIDLDQYRPNNVRVLSGRDVGKKYRKSLNLNKLEKENDKIIVKVPDDIYSINSSYFLGMFGPSVRELGKENFNKIYEFECDEIIFENIKDGIEAATKNSNVLRD